MGPSPSDLSDLLAAEWVKRRAAGAQATILIWNTDIIGSRLIHSVTALDPYVCICVCHRQDFAHYLQGFRHSIKAKILRGFAFFKLTSELYFHIHDINVDFAYLLLIKIKYY